VKREEFDALVREVNALKKGNGKSSTKKKVAAAKKPVKKVTKRPAKKAATKGVNR
jgi:hypothetical protein